MNLTIHIIKLASSHSNRNYFCR